MFTTGEKKRRFLESFARNYDLPSAASAAKIGRLEAYRLLKTSREEVDRLVLARINGALLTSIRREYEQMAFDGTGEIKASERIRALENLRGMAAADRGEERVPPLVIHCEYV